MAIKYQGTTVADIGARFRKYNYIVLGGAGSVYGRREFG